MQNYSPSIFIDPRNLSSVVMTCRVEGGTSSQMDLLHISSLAHPAAVVMCGLTVLLLLAGVAGHGEAVVRQSMVSFDKCDS